MISFYGKLKKHYSGIPLAVFTDNGGPYKAFRTREACKDLDILQIFNLPYRPDLAGIESVWSHVKAHYRSIKVQYLVAGQSWDNNKIVRRSIELVDH